MRAMLMFGFSLMSYAVFFCTFLYAIGFIGNLGLPKTIDRPADIAPVNAADWIVDLLLLGIFAVQHSGMARRGFKRWLTRGLSPVLERSLYVLMSSLVLALLFWQWRPLPATVWHATALWAQLLLYALFAAGWLLVFTSTFVISHFDLTGLRQVWLHLRGRAYTEVPFKKRLFYSVVRHPLMLGFVIAFWATPHMSVGHLLFALAASGYIVLAVNFLEERDLVRQHGDAYRVYRQQVPMLCPWPRTRRAKASRKLPQT